MKLLLSLAAFLLITTGEASKSKWSCRSGLARYRLVFQGAWSEETFPKQYPKFRPPAQWSLLLGIPPLPFCLGEASKSKWSCRSGLARYRLVFQGAWSEETFPKQYPKFRPPAQWSLLLGIPPLPFCLGEASKSKWSCRSGLARYRLVFQGAWSEETFPKQYPKFRPPAQWSLLLGIPPLPFCLGEASKSKWSCRSGLARYRLVFQGAWSEETFPKQYPKFRPPAQWSLLLGIPPLPFCLGEASKSKWSCRSGLARYRLVFQGAWSEETFPKQYPKFRPPAQWSLLLGIPPLPFCLGEASKSKWSCRSGLARYRLVFQGAWSEETFPKQYPKFRPPAQWSLLLGIPPLPFCLGEASKSKWSCRSGLARYRLVFQGAWSEETFPKQYPKFRPPAQWSLLLGIPPLPFCLGEASKSKWSCRSGLARYRLVFQGAWSEETFPKQYPKFRPPAQWSLLLGIPPLPFCLGEASKSKWSCRSGLARYRLVFQGAWSEETFPKQYPKFRPPAQWSLLLGIPPLPFCLGEASKSKWSCRSGLARYRLVFQGAWSEETFPKQYPKFRPPAQWSLLLGIPPLPFCLGEASKSKWSCRSGLARYRLVFQGAWSEETFPKQYPKFRPPAQWSLLLGIPPLPFCLGEASKSKWSCRSGLARYRLVFQGAWSEETFPKQYPKFRPPAQWSLLLGRSHSGEYRLWSKGLAADPSFQAFVENGDMTEIERREAQGFNGILDAFSASPIAQGVGESAADFFVDANHTRLSAAVKIVPSPDWFVGVDSEELCEKNTWRSSFTIPLYPHDAGTDQGFTFTSPNWASKPAEKIYEIEADFPSHRASSFYYPDIDKLPALGHLRVELVSVTGSEETIRDVSHRREEPVEEQTETSVEEREKLEEQLILAGEPIATQSRPIQNFADMLEETKQIQSDSSSESVERERTPTVVHIRRPAEPVRRRPVRRDCVVGDWASWSLCSKTCGFGVQRRDRRVVAEPREGRPCPPLRQEKWCGSMRNCQETRRSVFSWIDKPARRTHRTHRRH